ncbi:MurR/RpiR family transcriptional regulator [Chelativorans salis]|uniref:SIS domain-containing protein n=1 Tax=Chelativorans salis TaxID=2978478 RepID=A0ABT2LQJ9_9HYPH|nr:SIS domain-containing protein [Chelativorans sp. EGI FJ00035]MCT7376822.1 SIS domain-containing protein [Chelativorans sp. EGI FJ00035]
MIRLAAWLGLDSYDDLRAICAQAWRESGSIRYKKIDSRQPGIGKGNSAVTGVAHSLTAQMTSLGCAPSAEQLLAAASVLASARRRFCFGLQSSEMIACYFAEVMFRLDKHAAMVNLAPENEADATPGARAGDAMLVANFAPYSQATDKLARQMARRGVAIVAITDSETSPLHRTARSGIVVPTNAHSFFPSMTTAVAATEILATLTAQKMGTKAEEAAA